MPPNPNREQQIREFYNAIDTARAIDFEARGEGNALSAAVYVPDLHKDGFYLPRRGLLNAIRNNASADHYFFTGLRGSGKTTELRRLKGELEHTGEFLVFYADMTEYLPVSAPVEIGDFLLVVLAALAGCVHEDRRFQQDFTKAGYLERFVQFLKTEVELDGFSWGVEGLLGKADFSFKLKQNPLFKEALQKKSRGVIDGLVRESRQFVDQLVSYLREKTKPDMRVVFLVDSVERVRGVGEEAKKVFDSVENLFGSHRDKLRFSTLTVVYSVPPYISAVATAGAGALVHALPMVKVFERPEPGKHGAEHGPGVDRIVELIERRYCEWRTFFTEDSLRRLIRNTGGDLRELFLLLREALNLVDPDDDASFPIPEAAISQAERLRRNQFGVVPEKDMQWLARVVATHEHGLPSLEELGTFARLVDGKLMLQYRNGDCWWDAHPLLWERIERHASAVPRG